MTERRRDAPAQRRAGSDRPDGRPTVHPPFDVEKYAKESENKLRNAEAAARARDDAPVVDAIEEMSDADAEEIYRARLGGEDQVLLLARTSQELLRIPRRPDEGFVIALVDGERTVADVVRACELPRVATLLAICDLLDAGIVSLHPKG
jgi:hypothetical protein